MYYELKNKLEQLEIWKAQIRSQLDALSTGFTYFNTQLATLLNKFQQPTMNQQPTMMNQPTMNSSFMQQPFTHSYNSSFMGYQMPNQFGMQFQPSNQDQQKKDEKPQDSPNSTPVRSRRFKKDNKKLSDSVLSELKRLGAIYKEGKPRQYKGCNFQIPTPIQFFCDHKLKVHHAEKKFDVDFTGEFTLEEPLDWMKNFTDAMLIGEGESVLIAVLQQDYKQDISDFNVYILYDDKDDAEVMKLSEFLAGCVRAQ